MLITCLKRHLGKLAPWLAASLLLMPGLASAEYALTFQEPVTEIAHDLLGLHNLILYIVTAIFIVVFAVMFYSIFAHRKSKGHEAAKFDESTKVEVVWTIIPFFILVAMAIPSTKALLKMDDTSNSDLTLKITGYQWKWHYEYMDQGVSFFSNLSTPREQIENKQAKGDNYLLEVDNHVVLPVGKKVKLLVTANDVIHAWWVPALAAKKDAIPGFINELWTKVDKPGIYRGQCAELCGKDHGYMPIVVEAVSEEEFTKWVSLQKDKAASAAADAGKTWTKDELMARGKEVYAGTCAACHGPEGKAAAPIFPDMTGSKIANGPVAAHLDMVMNGSKKNTMMAAYKGQLNDVDLAAVVTYERNAFGNKAGDMVQPAQVKAAR